MLQLDNVKAKTVARIRQGCRLEEDFRNDFVKDGKITIVLNRSQAGFQVAQEVCNAINTINSSTSKNQSSGSHNGVLAKALDQVNIEVTIPEHNMDDIVDFVAQVMNQPILLENGGRVIINERTGSIVISGDVEIGAVAVTHKNMVIDTGAAPLPTGRYAKLETAQKENPKLQNLISALNALKVSAEDQITIIKGIERDGKLYGMLIIE
jgi:flagellar P-ring protein precursor FlgI